MLKILSNRMWEIYVIAIVIIITSFSRIPTPKFTIDTFWYILILSGVHVAREYLRDHKDD